MSERPFASVEDYERFIYSLPSAYPEIKESSLVLVRSGARLAAVREVDELQVTFPHHKHVPPEIKRNRIPAPGITFTTPNLPQLIREILGSENANGKA